MTFEQIQQSIKNKEFAPVYFLHGEEAFYIEKLTESFLTQTLTDIEREFNLNVFYGKDANPSHIISAAMQYPMMAEKRLVVLKEGQQMKESDLNLLNSYITKPAPSTILVIQYKGKKYPMKRGKLGEALKENAIIFESNKLYESKIPQWIIKHGKSLNLNITTDAAGLLTELLGNDLSNIDNELQKLKISIGDKNTIQIEDVRKNISLSREYNIFELSNALGMKNKTKVFAIIDTFSYNPNQYPVVFVISVLFGYFTKLIIMAENIRKSDKELASIAKVNPFFVRDYKKALKNYSLSQLYSIIDILKEYDLKSKGLNSRSFSSIELIKEMAIKILS